MKKGGVTDTPPRVAAPPKLAAAPPDDVPSPADAPAPPRGAPAAAEGFPHPAAEGAADNDDEAGAAPTDGVDEAAAPATTPAPGERGGVVHMQFSRI